MSLAQLQLRRGTAAEWTATNPVLAEAELGYETDTTKMKVGDGATKWNLLVYWGGGGGFSKAEAEAIFDKTEHPVKVSGTPSAGQVITALTPTTAAWAGIESTVAAVERTVLTYTLILSDANTAQDFNTASLTDITFPTHASVPFALGTIVEFAALGTGQLKFKGAGAVKLLTSSSLVTRERNSVVSFRLRSLTSEGEWLASGDFE